MLLINPTAKAQNIFTGLPAVADSAQGKLFATTNPLFSWHATYFNVQRKKILLLVNDLTYFPIVLADINAANKKKLAEIFPAAVYTAFIEAGIAPTQVEKYLALAGDIKINAGFNRVVVGVMNLQLRYLEHHSLDLMEILQVKASQNLGKNIVKENYPVDNLRQAFQQELKLTEVNTADVAAAQNYQIEKTWLPYANWGTFQAETATSEEYDVRFATLTANNRLVLAEFEKYLLGKENLSAKVAHKHVENVDTIINEFFLYDMAMPTPISQYELLSYGLGDWGVDQGVWLSLAAVKKAGTALKKFYRFLVAAGEIPASALKEIDEEIAEGIAGAESNFQLRQDFDYFDF